MMAHAAFIVAIDPLHVAVEADDAGFDADLLHQFAQGRFLDRLAGLDEARERHHRTGRMGLSGPAIQAMRDLAEYHDLQRTSISRGEYEKWIVKTRNRIVSLHPSLKREVSSP